jgi:hypothetical protein
MPADTPVLHLTKRFGNHAFEGEVDAFPRKTVKKTHDHCSFGTAKVQSQWMRVTLLVGFWSALIAGPAHQD